MREGARRRRAAREDMTEDLYNLLQGTTTYLGFQDVALRVAVAAVMGIAVAVAHRSSRSDATRTSRFGVTLVLFAMLASVVSAVSVDDPALAIVALAMIAAVRPRLEGGGSDGAVFEVWSVVAGVCCGAGQYVAAAVGSVAALLVLLLSGRIRDDDRLLLVVRGARSRELAIEGEVFNFFDGRALQRSKSSEADVVEMSFELTRRTLDRAQSRANASITETLLATGGVDRVSLVSQGAKTDG